MRYQTINLAKNKTPGSDGLTVRVEFYLCFWEYVATSLKDCLNDAYVSALGEMSISQKKNKDTRLLRNWWPIALLNIDYKMATKCTAKRLKKVLPRERAMSKIALLERKHSVDF